MTATLTTPELLTPAPVRSSDLLGFIGRAIDAMRVTQRLFGLTDGHILMTACKELENEYDRSSVSDETKLPPVLDACCGGRAFWFDKQDSRALFVDKRQGVFPIVRKTPRSPVVVKPDWCGSFTAMPFPTDTFDHIIFDPPHLVGPNATGNLRKTYGSLGEGWREELRGGFAECFRVLRPGGTLIFKWCEYHVPVAEVLALTPEKPLYGHRSGKQSKTHWCAFLKPNDQALPQGGAKKGNDEN